MQNKIFSLLFFLVGLLGLSKLSSLFAYGCTLAWHDSLIAPFFAPPKWLFGVVWPILYVLLAISAWIVWESRDRQNVWNAMVLFFAHMSLNLLWSPLYFCVKSVLLGVVLIILITYMALLNYRQFRQINPLAGQLMLPYLAWISFALILSLSYFVLNYPCSCFKGFSCYLVAGNC